MPIDKVGQRELLAERAPEIARPAHVTIDLDRITDAMALVELKRLRYPLVVKPSDGGGGLGVFLVEGPRRLQGPCILHGRRSGCGTPAVEGRDPHQTRAWRMCRLILAKGTFSSARILDAAIAMSCGRTADHEGPTQRHPNGWGAIWRRGGRLAIHRDVRSIEDSAGASPVRDLTTDFLAVHVRHATLARNHGAEFTHPLEYAHVERSWYLLHNGFLPTIYQRLGKDRSEFDSAEYLEYLMRGAGEVLDLDATRDKLAAIPPGGTSANAFLVTDERVYVIHWTPADTSYPRYFTMHRLDEDGCTIIASEIVESLAPRERWRAMPARTIEHIPLTA